MPAFTGGTSQGNTHAFIVHPDAPLVLVNPALTSKIFLLGNYWDQSKGPPKGMSLNYTITDEVDDATFQARAGEIEADGDFVNHEPFTTVPSVNTITDYWGDVATVESYDALSTIGKHVKLPLHNSSAIQLALNGAAGTDSFTVASFRIDWWY